MKTCWIFPSEFYARRHSTSQFPCRTNKLSCTKLWALENLSHFFLRLECKEAWEKQWSISVIIHLDFYYTQASSMCGFMFCVYQQVLLHIRFRVLSRHFLLPWLLWHWSHFLLSAVCFFCCLLPRLLCPPFKCWGFLEFLLYSLWICDPWISNTLGGF